MSFVAEVEHFCCTSLVSLQLSSVVLLLILNDTIAVGGEAHFILFPLPTFTILPESQFLNPVQ
jgi:hypothetical protein